MLTFAIIVIITLCTWTMTIVKILCIPIKGRNKKFLNTFIDLLIQVKNYALFKCLRKTWCSPTPLHLLIKAWYLPSSITRLSIRISGIGVSIWIFIALKWRNKALLTSYIIMPALNTSQTTAVHTVRVLNNSPDCCNLRKPLCGEVKGVVLVVHGLLGPLWVLGLL